MSMLGPIAVMLSARTAAFTAGMTRASTSVKGLGLSANTTNASLIGLQTTILATAAVVGVVAGISVRNFATFEEKMRNVNVIAKQNEEQFKKTSKAVLDLSIQVAKSPTDLADALYNINSASFLAAEGLKVLEAAAIAGRAGVATTAQAAKAITGVLNAYGWSADRAGDVSDVLFKTVEKGVLTFSDLAENMGAVNAMAAGAKIDIAEVAAAIATMTRGGIQSSEAFTAMNRMMVEMVRNKDKISAFFKKSAEGSAMAMIEARGLAGTMQHMADQTGGLAKELVRLFSRMRAFKAALSLTRKEGGAFAGDIKAVATQSNRAGATLAALKEQTKATAFQFQKFKTIMRVWSIEIGSVLGPKVGKLFKRFNDNAVGIKAVMQQFWIDIKLPWELLWDYVSTMITNVTMQLMAFVDNAVKVFKNLRTAAAGLETAVTTSMGDWLFIAWEKMQGRDVNAKAIGIDFGKSIMDGLAEELNFTKVILDKVSTNKILAEHKRRTKEIEEGMKASAARIKEAMALKPKLPDIPGGVDPLAQAANQYAAAVEKGTVAAYQAELARKDLDKEIEKNTSKTAQNTKAIVSAVKALVSVEPEVVAI